MPYYLKKMGSRTVSNNNETLRRLIFPRMKNGRMNFFPTDEDCNNLNWNFFNH